MVAELADSGTPNLTSTEVEAALPVVETTNLSHHPDTFNGAANQPASETKPPKPPANGKPNLLMMIMTTLQGLMNGEGLSALFNNLGGAGAANPLAQFTNVLKPAFGIATGSMAEPASQQHFANLGDVTSSNTSADVSDSYVSQTRQALVAQTRSHLGRTESSENAGIEDITGEFNKRPWCASFIAKQVSAVLPNTVSGASSLGIKAQAEQAGAFEQAGNGYIPQPGDLMVKDRGTAYDNKGHIGMVSSVDLENRTYTTIEGNVDMGHPSGRDGVREITRSLDDFKKDRVFGFVNTVDAHLARNDMTPNMTAETQFASNAPALGVNG